LAVVVIVRALLRLIGPLSLIIVTLILRFAPHVPGHVPTPIGAAFPLAAYGWTAYGAVVSVLELVAATALLRLRAWGRTALEGLMWLSAILSAGYIMWLLAHPGPARMAVGVPLGPPSTTSLGLLVNSVALAIACVLLYFLRSRAVREAMRP
jgi:hypothetical protein